MLKKGSEIVGVLKPNIPFNLSSMLFSDTLVLISPDFEKEFLIFCFASHDTLAAPVVEKFKGF
jgi:hypothetical protein